MYEIRNILPTFGCERRRLPSEKDWAGHYDDNSRGKTGLKDSTFLLFFYFWLICLIFCVKYNTSKTNTTKYVICFVEF